MRNKSYLDGIGNSKKIENPPVFDTSVLVSFSSVGEMPLLKALFPAGLIPGAVYRELVTQGSGWTQAKEAQEEALAAQWLLTVDLADTRIPLLGSPKLDAGEREVISLAFEKGLIPVLDERPGRREAQALGMRPIGTLGILAVAKASGLVNEIAPTVARMRSRGLRFGDRLLKDFLKDFDERWPP